MISISTGQTSGFVDVVYLSHLSHNHHCSLSMALTKNESVCFGVRVAFKARGPRVMSSILRLVIAHEPFEIAIPPCSCKGLDL
jgi:hypothetical protein